jgi:hypothetical protein
VTVPSAEPAPATAWSIDRPLYTDRFQQHTFTRESHVASADDRLTRMRPTPRDRAPMPAQQRRRRAMKEPQRQGLELFIVVVRAPTVGVLRPSGNSLGKPCPTATAGGLPPPDEASAPPEARPTLLDAALAKLEKLARRVFGRVTGHRHPAASRLASPPMDATLTTATGWPSTN